MQATHWTRPRWFVGVIKAGIVYRTVIFKSLVEPTEESHGHLYTFTWGAYRTRASAIESANYQGCHIIE
jgi:hypothetical protein